MDKQHDEHDPFRGLRSISLEEIEMLERAHDYWRMRRMVEGNELLRMMRAQVRRDRIKLYKAAGVRCMAEVLWFVGGILHRANAIDRAAERLFERARKIAAPIAARYPVIDHE